MLRGAGVQCRPLEEIANDIHDALRYTIVFEPKDYTAARLRGARLRKWLNARRSYHVTLSISKCACADGCAPP